MSHSHLAIRHLIRQLEEFSDRRAGAGANKVPEWLRSFIQGAADLFEPFSGVARPGFECRRGDERWELSLFLGKTEVVGGAQDGELAPVNFAFDVAAMSRLFDRLDVLRWNAFPDCHVCDDGVLDLSFLMAEGLISGEAVTLQVHAGPPDGAGPALKRYSDGSYATI